MTRSHTRSDQSPPHLRGREALQISPDGGGLRTRGGKFPGEKPQQTGPGFNRTSAHPGGPRTRNTRAGRAHDTQAQPPRSAAPTGSTPPPGAESFNGPYPMPRVDRNAKNFPRSAAQPNRPRAYGPDCAQNRGPISRNIPRS